MGGPYRRARPSENHPLIRKCRPTIDEKTPASPSYYTLRKKQQRQEKAAPLQVAVSQIQGHRPQASHPMTYLGSQHRFTQERLTASQGNSLPNTKRGRDFKNHSHQIFQKHLWLFANEIQSSLDLAPKKNTQHMRIVKQGGPCLGGIQCMRNPMCCVVCQKPCQPPRQSQRPPS